MRVGIVSSNDLHRSDGATPIDDVTPTAVVAASPDVTVRDAANLLRPRDVEELLGRGAAKPVARGGRTTVAARGPRELRPTSGRRPARPATSLGR
jgi:CBS domain-containing protein